MIIVVDASVVIAALVDNTQLGEWAEDILRAQSLVAPEQLPFEVANALRRLQLADHISADVASLAHRDLLLIPVDLVEYELLAARVWALRDYLTCYDASYVSLAENLGAPLATLDAKLSKAPGTSCEFRLPPTLS